MFEAIAPPALPSTVLHFEKNKLRAIGTAVARFLHTEDVTGSIPVSPIPSLCAGSVQAVGRPQIKQRSVVGALANYDLQLQLSDRYRF